MRKTIGFIFSLLAVSVPLLQAADEVGLRMNNKGEVTGLVQFGDKTELPPFGSDSEPGVMDAEMGLDSSTKKPDAASASPVPSVAVSAQSGATPPPPVSSSKSESTVVQKAEVAPSPMSPKQVTEATQPVLTNAAGLSDAEAARAIRGQSTTPPQVAPDDVTLVVSPKVEKAIQEELSAPVVADDAALTVVRVPVEERDVWTVERNREVARLKQLPSVQVPFDRAPLRAVLMALSMMCKMQVMAPRDGDFADVVTLNVNMNPYDLLVLLCQRYNVGLHYERGVWQFFKPNMNELVWRSYKIHHDDLLDVQIEASSFNKDLNETSSSTTASAKGKDDETFKIPAKLPIEERVKSLLRLPTTAARAKVARMSWQGDYGPFGDPSIDADIYRDTGEAKVVGGENIDDRVAYVPQTGTLMVLATRQQHEYVETLLDAVDRPKQQIQYKARLYETTLDKTRNVGIDWSKVTSASATLSKYAGEAATNGFGMNQAILSASDLTVAVKAIAGSDETKLVSEPMVVGYSYAPVAIQSVEQRPVRSLVVSGYSSSSDATESSIRYIQIGISFNVFGRVLDYEVGGKRAIQLWVSVVDSQMVGTVKIDEDEVPVVASQEVRFPVVVPDGYTLAVGGVCKEKALETITKVPLLGDIPLIKYVFRTSSKERTNSTLLAFITPKIITDKNGNLTVAVSDAAPAPKAK